MEADISFFLPVPVISHTSTCFKRRKYLNESGKDCSYITWGMWGSRVGSRLFNVQECPHDLYRTICHRNPCQSKSLRKDKLTEEIPQRIKRGFWSLLKPQVGICIELIKSQILLHLQPPLMNIHEDASLTGDNPLCLYIPFIAKYHTWDCWSQTLKKLPSISLTLGSWNL